MDLDAPPRHDRPRYRLAATSAPIGAAGTVQFKDGTTNIGDPVSVTAGLAVGGFVSLPLGPHSLTAVFTPTNPAAFQPSTSNAVQFTFSDRGR
ncbi:MAG: Ig-like domain-containing protein [Pseudonocardiaceae bacterium]